MTAAQTGDVPLRSRASRVFGTVLAVSSVLFMALGCLAFGYSFLSTPGEKRDDAYFGVVMFAGIAAAMAVLTLQLSAVPLALRWWRPYWLLPPVILLTLCILRIAVATYTY